MEEDVAGRGHGMTRPGPDLPERVELRRPGSGEKPVPGGGTEPHYAGEVALEVPKGHRSNESWEVFAKASDGPAVVIAGLTVTTWKIAARVSGATTGCGCLWFSSPFKS